VQEGGARQGPGVPANRKTYCRPAAAGIACTAGTAPQIGLFGYNIRFPPAKCVSGPCSLPYKSHLWRDGMDTKM
jgi:hypothetical protein